MKWSLAIVHCGGDIAITDCHTGSINSSPPSAAYMHRQSQVRKPTGSGVEWAECSLIIGTGCRVQVLLELSSLSSSFAWVQVLLELSSIVSGHSVCWRFGVWDLGMNPAFSRGRQLVPIRFENHLSVPLKDYTWWCWHRDAFCITGL